MYSWKGKTMCQGIAMGPVVVLKRKSNLENPEKIQHPEDEVVRVKDALDVTMEQLERLQNKATLTAGEDAAKIFEVHQMILKDPQYIDEIYRIISTEQVNAEYAVVKARESILGMFANMDDDYMQARGEDIKDISNRMVENLRGQSENDFYLEQPSILLAEELTPGEIMQLDPEKILAFVTIHGSVYSHTAILAEMLDIPALTEVPLEFEKIEPGMIAIVDGEKGQMMLEPDTDVSMKTEEKMKQQREKRKFFEDMKGKENITKDGHRIRICANIGSIKEVAVALENEAEGIGLFRSEFLYMGRKDLPTEEEQYQVYKQVAEKMPGKKVIIRTMDIGGDKQTDSFSLEKEENPALGCRGIRFCLKHEDVFKIQLRALFRAAVCGNIAVMYPMITSVEEVKQIYNIVDKVKRELEGEGYSFRIPEQGIMIETPAAVMISDELAEIVEFFSIGTNDLTQYTLAMDRQNENLAHFYQPHHKAVLRMIELVVQNGHKHGKKVSICGELGADTTLTQQFISMGIDELSVVSSKILELRKAVRASIALTKD